MNTLSNEIKVIEVVDTNDMDTSEEETKISEPIPDLQYLNTTNTKMILSINEMSQILNNLILENKAMRKEIDILRDDIIGKNLCALEESTEQDTKIDLINNKISKHIDSTNKENSDLGNRISVIEEDLAKLEALVSTHIKHTRNTYAQV